MKGMPPLKRESVKRGKTKNEEQVAMHWKAFGWDEKTGHPLPETIESLGINRLMEV